MKIYCKNAAEMPNQELYQNANVTEYKYATGFEALIGYLYLKMTWSAFRNFTAICGYNKRNIKK